MANYQIAEISLYESSLYMDQTQGFDKTQRLNLLYECLLSTKNFFSTHFGPDRLLSSNLSFASWTQFGQALIVGFKLCFLLAEGWDLHHVREQLQLPRVLDSQIEKIEEIISTQTQQIERSPGLDGQIESYGDSSIFLRYVQQMRQVKVMYENQVAGEIYGLNVCE